MMASIGLFLGLQSVPTLSHYGWSFFTENDWQPERDTLGISAVLLGTLQVALVALTFAFPLAFGTALFITEVAPPRLRSFLVSLVDLMAAVPSIVYGLWGFFLLQPHALNVSRWLHTHLGFIPFFQVDTDPNAAAWAQSRYTASAFIAGLAVAMMVVPSACAVMREVFSQTPVGEREAALALGATRWGTIRMVVLPFGRGGIIGGTMLSLGRALGETIAVVLIISTAFDLKVKPLETGTSTVSALIAGRFGEATTVAALRPADRRLRALRHHPHRQHDRRGHRQPWAQRRRDGGLSHGRRPSSSRRPTPSTPCPRRRAARPRRPAAAARPSAGGRARARGFGGRLRWPSSGSSSKGCSR